MAAPHVAGIAARLLEVDPGAGPSRITSLLTGSATSGTVDDANGSPNLLANLVDFEEVDCSQPIEDGDEVPEDCLDEYCAGLEELGEELPEICLEEDDEREGDGDGREGEGRPVSPPGLSGLVPPGFGGAVPGLDRAPGLQGRTPPGLSDGGAPGLVRDVPRVNGLSIVRDGSALRAEWRASGTSDAFVVECSALPSGPNWRTDLTLRIAADAVARAGDRVSVGLPAQVEGLARCRVAAELDQVLGVRSNAANVPTASSVVPPPDAEPEADSVTTPPAPAGTDEATTSTPPVRPTPGNPTVNPPGLDRRPAIVGRR
jgi:hypothetical protein